MPVTVKLDDLLHARRMTLTELAERIDLTLANLSILKTGKAKAIRFSTLEAICRELECQPGDLLDNAVKENARRGARTLRGNHEFAERIRDGKLKIVAARYDLDDGKVELLDV